MELVEFGCVMGGFSLRLLMVVCGTYIYPSLIFYLWTFQDIAGLTSSLGYSLFLMKVIGSKLGLPLS